MLFFTSEFAIFLTVVFTAYWLMPWHQARVWLLLVASFYFYASWNKWLALLIFVTCTLDYYLAIGIESADTEKRRRLLLTISIVCNIGLLVYFKYANFFLDSIHQTLAYGGVHTTLPVLEVILPVGISFYTFEAINYVMDVYRRTMSARRGLPSFLLFVTFFPHLVAGPIVRARKFIPQIEARKKWDWNRLYLGAGLFTLGVVKKVLIADRLAFYIDPIFASMRDYDSAALWLGAIGYSIQIYCDFSGYSDMAIGTAHLFGYKLSKNFDMPYLAQNISLFWRRWHMSLSSWLRDYVFIPLGGSRMGGRVTDRNLLITMLIGGIWHGAAWTFILWGGVHGILLVTHRWYAQLCAETPALQRFSTTLWARFGGWFLTLLSVVASWVIFRAQSVPDAFYMLGKMVIPATGSMPSSASIICLAVALLLMAAGHFLGANARWRSVSLSLPGLWIGVVVALVLTLAMAFSIPAGKTFIYFQF